MVIFQFGTQEIRTYDRTVNEILAIDTFLVFGITE